MKKFVLALTLALGAASVSEAGPLRRAANRVVHPFQTARCAAGRVAEAQPIRRALTAPARAIGGCAGGKCAPSGGCSGGSCR